MLSAFSFTMFGQKAATEDKFAAETKLAENVLAAHGGA
jgi:hypothetical protein